MYNFIKGGVPTQNGLLSWNTYGVRYVEDTQGGHYSIAPGGYMAQQNFHGIVVSSVALDILYTNPSLENAKALFKLSAKDLQDLCISAELIGGSDRLDLPVEIGGVETTSATFEIRNTTSVTIKISNIECFGTTASEPNKIDFDAFVQKSVLAGTTANMPVLGEYK